ncbi:hypothetical protein BKA69DRAFT_1052447 [Paraphysoderma sedebokerense]|nr:hypothetical protein BKA69DRAFT_1052447 [Paraphysoderma sedebokerense]
MNLPWTLPPIHRPFFISTILLVVVMILLGFTPIQLPPGSDKILHLLMFALLSISIFCMWKKPIKWKTIVSAACMLCLSVGSELVQGLVSHRSFDWFDILVNYRLCAIADRSIQVVSQYDPVKFTRIIPRHYRCVRLELPL